MIKFEIWVDVDDWYVRLKLVESFRGQSFI